MGSCSGGSTPLGNTPVREHAATTGAIENVFAERISAENFAKNSPNNVEDMTMMSMVRTLKIYSLWLYTGV